LLKIQKVNWLGLGGFESFVLGRYQSDGSLDKSFGRESGSATNFFGVDSLARTLALQPDGKIVAAGTGFFGAAILARYLPDGRLDRSFGKDGQARLGHGGGGAMDVAVLPGGRILATGFGIGEKDCWKAAVIAFRPDGGAIDHRYNGDGLSTFTAAGGEASIEFSAMQVLPGGKLLLAGEIGGRVMVTRLRRDGTPDPTFGEGGFAYPNPNRCYCAEATGIAFGLTASSTKASARRESSAPSSATASLLTTWWFSAMARSSSPAPTTFREPARPGLPPCATCPTGGSTAASAAAASSPATSASKESPTPPWSSATARS
jgi:uncharacterized delta-60 repeat protein